MIKVVINKCHGGFGLSVDATMHLINTKSELVNLVPLTEYTGEETIEAAIADMNRYGPDDDHRYLGEHFQVGSHGAVFNTETGMVYCIEYSMPQLDGEADEDWWARRDFQTILFRTHPDLVGVVESLGEAAGGQYSDITIVEIPDEDITVDQLDIGEYDGSEWVSERHRTWS